MDGLEELLKSPTVQLVIGAVVLLLVGRWLYGVLTRPKAAGVFLRIVCGQCGWKGTVGKYNKKCSQCGSTSLRELS